MNRAVAGAAAAAAAAVLAGCVSLPTGGGVSPANLSGSSGQAAQGIQLVAMPPAVGWQPAEIVAGFLAASGSSVTGSAAAGAAVSGNSLAIARSYLSPRFARAWRPGTAATVIDAMPGVHVTTIPSTTRINGEVSGAQVNVTSQHVEMLQSPGNIVVSPKSHIYQFNVIQVSGQWRIDSVYADGTERPDLLLLLRPDFERDYQPRNLYFFPAASSARTLIPDPVFIPQQQGTQAGVLALVNGLLSPAGWLTGAVTTAFPAGTKIRSVQVSGVTAVVDLGGAATRASRDRLRRMAAQLVWTLTNSPYSALTSPAGTPTGTGIESVELQVGDRPAMPLLLQQDFRGYVAAWAPAAAPLIYQAAGPGGLRRMVVIRPGSAAAAAASLPRNMGTGPFTAIAGSPAAAGTPALVAACRGRTVYMLPLRLGVGPAGAPLIRARLPASCSSLAFDDHRDLWATAGTGVYVLRAGGTGASGHSAFVQALTEPGRLSGLRVAPDGVRVAMVEATRSGGEVLVAAISRSAQPYLALNPQTVRVGSDISRPVTLAWQDPDHLFVISKSGGIQQLFSVPLNGGDSTLSPTLLPPGTITSLQADGASLVIGTASPGSGPAPAQGAIWIGANAANGQWRRLPGAGATPAVAG